MLKIPIPDFIDEISNANNSTHIVKRTQRRGHRLQINGTDDFIKVRKRPGFHHQTSALGCKKDADVDIVHVALSH